MAARPRSRSGRGAARHFRLPLRFHIAALILLLFGAVALLAGAVVSRGSQALVDRTALASFTGSADLALQELRRLEQTAKSAADALAADPIVDARSEGARAGRLQALAMVLRSVPGISAAYIGWPNGDFVLLRPLARLGARLSAPPGAAWLAQWSRRDGNRFDFLDERLGVVQTRSDLDYDFDPRTRPWFRDAMATTKTIVTSPYIFFTTREPGITAAQKARSGAVVGVDIALWELSQRLPRGRPAPSTEAAILDRKGGILAYSDPRRLQSLFDGAKIDGSLKSGSLPQAEALGSPVITALARRLAASPQRYVGTLAAGGRIWLATVVPLDVQGTAFVMAAPADELGRGPRLVRERLLHILGAALAVVVAAVWFAGGLVARPVERFARDAKRMAKLDFAASPPVKTRVSELANLDDAIRSMRHALRERIKELRCLYRVLELTADPARPVNDICRDVARILPASLLHDEVAVARLVVDGGEYLSGNWQAPVASLRAAIRDAEPEAAFVEVGYREERPAQAGGEGPFLEEERDLVHAVAAHVRRMLQERRMAAELTRSERLSAIGQLTGGVAHDFNNLLTVILGNTDLLEEKLVGQENLRTLARMTASAAARGSELTRQLLAFSRRQALVPKPVDVNALLSGMQPLLRRTLPGNIELVPVHADGLWRASVDPTQLESAILNLCINARDAMPGGGRITITTANAAGRPPEGAGPVAPDPGAPGPGEAGAGAYVSIAVADSGVGMDRATVERAFEPFFTTKEVGKGSGLGLSMVYGFVSQSKGHVRVDSAPGRGTTVTLYLPRADGEAPPSRPDEEAAEAPVEPGTETILLVEDDEAVRPHVRDQLLGLGYRVVAVANGADALRALAQNQDVALLFTDVVMPGMSGPELAGQVRKLRPGLPVLFTSGYAGAAGALSGMGERPYLLQKPYRRHELAAKLRAVLKQKEG
jgi:signal transduction histidine kinase/HAMP domain-containing protein/ActR/RegA family two-component response regulator